MRSSLVIPLLLAWLTGVPTLWAAESSERASVPPGRSIDGAKPSGGALVGGSIQRDDERATPIELDRCRDLEGSLRKQCLRDVKQPERPPLPARP